MGYPSSRSRMSERDIWHYGLGRTSFNGCYDNDGFRLSRCEYIAESDFTKF